MNGDKSKLYVLQEPVHFAESRIWQMQENYYRTAGIDAWGKDQVPFYVTSNPVIAKAYAEIVFAFLKDRRRQTDLNEKIYLLELGAGHGRFCYYFLKHFEKLVSSYHLQLPDLCYVITDRVSSNLSFCRAHPRLQPFISKGWIDFAHVDLTDIGGIHLEVSGEDLTPGSLQQPMLVIGNYIFDSIPHDLFYITSKVVREVKLGLLLDEKYKSASEKEILENLRLNYEIQTETSKPYQQDFLNKIVDRYSKMLTDKYLHFPDTALRALHHLKSFSAEGLMLLVGDKGYYHAEELNLQEAPHLVTHGGCFSLSVNFHAFKEYCVNEGGLAFFPGSLAQSVYVGCLLLVPRPAAYSETIQSYKQVFNDFNPDDYFLIRCLALNSLPIMGLQESLANIRMSNYDPQVFIELLPRIQELLPLGISNLQRWNLFQTAIKVWEMYYPLGVQQNFPFMLGELFYRLAYFKEAITFLELSSGLYGETIATKGNFALCYLRLREFDKARLKVDEILLESPADETALALKEELNSTGY